MDLQNDFERILFFEYTRKQCEAAYKLNPLDAENLTRWGGALMELAQFQNVPESERMVFDGVSKLEEALSVDPKRADALWCLGNAYTSCAFLVHDENEAQDYFSKATACFQRAVDEEPENELFHKSLELSTEAPELQSSHQGISDEPEPASGPSNSACSEVSKKKSNDFRYEIFGWVILAVGYVAWVGFAKSQMPTPPSPR